MSAKDTMSRIARELRASAERLWQEARRPEQSTALSLFLQPNLGPTPPALRRVLEPVVAIAAVTALAVLASVGMLSFVSFAAAAVLMYAIITHVFGIELDLRPPEAW